MPSCKFTRKRCRIWYRICIMQLWVYFFTMQKYIWIAENLQKNIRTIQKSWYIALRSWWSLFLTAPASLQVSLRFDGVILHWLIHAFDVFYSITSIYRPLIDFGFIFTFALHILFGASLRKIFFFWELFVPSIVISLWNIWHIAIFVASDAGIFLSILHQ